MIRYALKCTNDHSFDSWFQSAGAFDKLRKAGMATCPVCGVGDVEKAIMTPRVATQKHDHVTQAPGPLSAPASPAEQLVAEMRRKVRENSEYVGEGFAAEARAIHEGDAPERSIYGEARADDAKQLIEDGVPVTPLPFMNDRKTN